MADPSNVSKLTPPLKVFSVDALAVRLFATAAEMAWDAAVVASDILEKAIAHRGEARVLLATGNSQIEFLEAAIALNRVDWSRVVFFHLDEYLGIPATHPASFRSYLRDRVENQVHPAAFHYINGDAIEPLKECDRYSQLLLEKPIDLCCLGVGENGHLAFNEPGIADFNDPYPIKLVKLAHATHQQLVNQAQFPTLESVPKYAFTLTIPQLCAAENIICLAPSRRKTQIVQQMLSNAITPEIPATILRSQSHATLFLDQDSAGEF
ncbi:glucosamine-6-phosphate deaminase [Oscillatoria acuminata]|uniref:6-phosphogluconolactonase/glucosamine-6-phosphate isomerase/deaminase n=1 Tax=Oscillatoria acuminata PCC 6304 TaxID=56110 RepID=K9THX2_9CYAN|nr:glucosamine-6-phosphate deaminase [Oscillatoria acuminata]AFY82467.1 6-phosphogluconolactonase/glucosamine-6-phosphate isomerase/deaminase [Oscillatoria acuminata PCC 6304]